MDSALSHEFKVLRMVVLTGNHIIWIMTFNFFIVSLIVNCFIWFVFRRCCTNLDTRKIVWNRVWGWRLVIIACHYFIIWLSLICCLTRLILVPLSNFIPLFLNLRYSHFCCLLFLILYILLALLATTLIDPCIVCLTPVCWCARLLHYRRFVYVGLLTLSQRVLLLLIRWIFFGPTLLLFRVLLFGISCWLSLFLLDFTWANNHVRVLNFAHVN